MSEEPSLLDAIFEQVPVGLAVVGPDLRYRRINRVLAEMNGTPAEDHIGRTVSEVLGETGAALEPLLRQVLETREASPELRLRGPTPGARDTRRDFVGSYVPVLDAGELCVLGVVAEVTAERAAATLVDAIYAATPVGLAFWTPDLRYARVNEYLAAINGRPAAEHIGATLEEVLGRLGPQVEERLRVAIAARHPVEAEYTAVRLGADGSERDFDVTYYPVLGADDELLGVGGIVRDVTARRAAEEERNRLLKDALVARAHAEAAQVRAEAAQEATEEARARTEFLAEAGRRLARSMQTGTTLQEVADIAVPQVADWCVISLASEGGIENVAVAHADEALLRRAREYGDRFPPTRDSPVGMVIATGDTQLVQPITDQMLVAAARDEDHLSLLRELGMSAVLVVPLAAPERTIGAVTLIRSGGRTFPPEDVSLAEALGSRAALHINNARLYGELAHIARTLQAGLLPRRLPSIPGIELAARYQAAGAQQVGGDFYDVFRTGGGTWIAMIGDVTGKGPEAAAVTSLARHTLRTMLGQNAEPARALRTLNDALREEVTDRFCTVVCAALELRDGGADVAVAAAGHPGPLVRRASGEVERVDASGTLVGALERIELDERRVRLEPGDLLLLYTDGLVDMRGREPGFGDRWLPGAIAREGDRPVAEILEELQRGAIELQDGIARDDMALLGLRPTLQE